MIFLPFICVALAGVLGYMGYHHHHPPYYYVAFALAMAGLGTGIIAFLALGVL